VETHAGDGIGREGEFERTPVEMTDVATGATIESAKVFVVPECGCHVGEDKAEARPEDDDGEAVDAFCEEKVDEETEAQADVGVERHWPLFEEMVENGTLPESNEGTSDADVMGRESIYDKTESKA